RNPTRRGPMRAQKLILLVGLGCIFAASHSHAAPAPQPSTAIRHETWTVRGLEKPAHITIDHWVVPQIFAASRPDAFLLEGHKAARDRLWQIDLWRKRGLGLLAKSFGPSFVEQDRATRLFLYRGDMAREWSAYARGSHEAAQAFVAGVNAYVAEVRAGAKPLPIEFKLTHSTPAEWSADDIVRIRRHTLLS